VLVLALAVPLLLTVTVLGTAADVIGARSVLLACGTTLAIAAGTALISRTLTAPGLTPAA
jgi:hypothetical protein